MRILYVRNNEEIILEDHFYFIEIMCLYILRTVGPDHMRPVISTLDHVTKYIYFLFHDY